MATGKVCECEPIRSIKDLLEFSDSDCCWSSLVEPIKPRSNPRYLGENCHQYSDDLCESGIRPQIMACHDYRGNYLYDRFVDGSADWNE
jgi:mannosyl-glycoprotein endo-beta-N-acetylglucosaminidase